MAKYNKGTIEELIDGTLDWNSVKNMMSDHKDPERMDTYVSILQERVPWDDPIILPMGLHLYIVSKENGQRMVKCNCGHEFCDYKDNWKLHARIYVRDTVEKMNEIYPKLMGPDPEWQVLREYYCPGCAAQLEVEAVPPWYPVIKEFDPDIDTFYNDWLGKPVPGES